MSANAPSKLESSNLKSSNLKWWSSPRTLLRYILGLDDSRHSIALGTAVGMFIGMTPTVGVQMIIVIVVAFLTKPLFHFNRMAALLTVYISNPLTMIPIYYFNYKVGTIFFGGDVSHAQFSSIFKYEGFQEWFNTIKELFVVIGSPLIVGSLVVATVLALPTYPLMRYLLKSFRRKSTGEKILDTTSKHAQENVIVSEENEEK